MLSRESLLAFQLTRQPLTDRESENHGRRHSDFSLAISLDAVAKSVGVAAWSAWLALLAAARSHVTKRGGLRKRRRAKPVKSRQARQTGRADACSLARLAQGDVRSCYCCCRSLARCSLAPHRKAFLSQLGSVSSNRSMCAAGLQRRRLQHRL